MCFIDVHRFFRLLLQFFRFPCFRENLDFVFPCRRQAEIFAAAAAAATILCVSFAHGCSPTIGPAWRLAWELCPAQDPPGGPRSVSPAGHFWAVPPLTVGLK